MPRLSKCPYTVYVLIKIVEDDKNRNTRCTTFSCSLKKKKISLISP